VEAKLQINAISVSEKWRRGAGFSGHEKKPCFLGLILKFQSEKCI